MTNKPFIRLVALILIPCLVADPGLAAVSSTFSIRSLSPISTSAFDTQAIPASASGAHFRRTLNIGATVAVILLLGGVFRTTVLGQRQTAQGQPTALELQRAGSPA